MASKKLSKYKKKRDFKKTPEPSGGKKKKSKKPVFVIQKHDANKLHYDFRLEVDGVLKSWAVPKGPSLDPSEKRLAVPTEDHPLEYAGFEGVIPEEEYGGGTVMVWDKGTYKNKKDIKMSTALKKGKLEIDVKGKKIKGGYALIRTGGKGKKKRWLLIKMDDKHADARRNPVASEPKSAKSNRTMKQIEKEDS